MSKHAKTLKKPVPVAKARRGAKSRYKPAVVQEPKPAEPVAAAPAPAPAPAPASAPKAVEPALLVAECQGTNMNSGVEQVHLIVQVPSDSPMFGKARHGGAFRVSLTGPVA